MGDVPLLRIEGFSGSDERWAAPPDSAVKLQNVRWDQRGGWERSPGLSEVANSKTPFSGQGKIYSMHWWSQHNGGPQFLMFEMGSKLCYFDGSAASYQTLATNRYTTGQPWQHTQYASAGNDLWIINGENAPLRFDGETVYRAGFDRPAPSVTVTGYSEGFQWGTSSKGLGLGTPMTEDVSGGGEYGYVLTEVNEYGTESPPSPAFAAVKWVIRVDGVAVEEQPKFGTVVRIPPPSSDQVVRRNLYRTMNSAALGLGEGVAFYLCAELQGRGSFPHFDMLPDTQLGKQLVPANIGPWPRGAKYMAIYKNVAWVAGMPDYPGRLWHSQPNEYENFPASNFDVIGDADGGEITGLREFRNCLVVFKRRGVFLVTGDAVRGFEVQTITKAAGCCAANTIREVPNMGGQLPQMMFASEDGIHILTGTLQVTDSPASTQSATAGLADFFRWQANHAAMANAWAEVDAKNREYLVSIPVGGNPLNTMILAYSYDVGTWGFRPGLFCGCMAATHDHRRLVYFGSNDDTDHPGLFVYTPGSATIDGTAMTVRLETAWWDLGGVYEHVLPMNFIARALEYGTGTLSVSLYRDRRQTMLTAGGQSRSQQDQEFLSNPPPVWGTATWDPDATWSKARPTVLPYDVVADTAGIGGAKEYQIVLESTSRTQIIGMLLRGQASGLINIPAANPVLGTGSAE